MRSQSFYRGGRIVGKPIYGKGVNTFLINKPEGSFYGFNEDSKPPSESSLEAFMRRSDVDSKIGKISGTGNGLDNVIKKLGNLKVGNSRTKNIAFDF